MKLKITFIFAFLFLFFSVRVAFAGVIINEVMYDLPGSDSANNKSREWIELYNPDSVDVSVDASKWRVNDGSSNRTINNEENFLIPSKSYIILAGDKDTFLTDNPSFSGIVYDTGIPSLNNTSATLKILNTDNIDSPIDTITYNSSQGAGGDGNSLQLISGAWKGATPTPGVVNENTPVVAPPPSGGGGVSIVNITTTEVKPKVVEIPKIKTKITMDSLAYVGIPLEISASTLGYSNEIRNYGKYFWNFNDGDSKEINVNQNTKFTHTYYYEGEYEITLEYYSNYYSDVPETINKFNVKVIPATIFISKVGDEKDFFIELSNKSTYDINVSNWMITSLNKNFTLPKNTNIRSEDKILLSSKITNFNIKDKDSLKLLKPTGEVAFNFSGVVSNIAQKEPIVPVSNTNLVVPVVPAVPSTLNLPLVSKKEEVNPDIIKENNVKNPIGFDVKSEEEIKNPTLDLSATALLGDGNEKNSNKSYLFFWIFVFLIFVSSGIVYYIRSRKNVSRVGDDFKILDE